MRPDNQTSFEKSGGMVVWSSGWRLRPDGQTTRRVLKSVVVVQSTPASSKTNIGDQQTDRATCAISYCYSSRRSSASRCPHTLKRDRSGTADDFHKLVQSVFESLNIWLQGTSNQITCASSGLSRTHGIWQIESNSFANSCNPHPTTQGFKFGDQQTRAVVCAIGYCYSSQCHSASRCPRTLNRYRSGQVDHFTSSVKSLAFVVPHEWDVANKFESLQTLQSTPGNIWGNNFGDQQTDQMTCAFSHC